MPRRNSILFGTVLCVVGGTLAVAQTASAVGYYNLPGSFCQCFGYGNGGGYHSCLVLGPSTCQGWCAPNEVRLPCPPRPPYYGGQCGAGNSASMLGEPVPTPAPQPAPEPAAMRLQMYRQRVAW